MHLDVIELRNFYYRTALGHAARRAIRARVHELWPSIERETVAGFGYALPVLRRYLKSARRVVSLMPAQQGVMHWPSGAANVCTLCEETHWPLQTGFVDRLIVLNGLEASEFPTALLAEAWRVLGPGGKAIFIVPNRAGLWSRSEVTPFGYGRPYSMSQLESQLRIAGFIPERHRAALFQPPSDRKFWLRSGALWERIGRRVPSTLAGGLLVVEVSKQVYARPNGGTPEVARKPAKLLEGLTPAPNVKPL